MAWFTKNKPVVMAVDDNPDVTLCLAQFLEASGYKVDRVHSGADALKRAAKAPPAIMVLDIMMPGTDGGEVLLKLKSNPGTKDIPVVMCSAINEMKEVEKCFKYGAVGYITKPFDNARVLETIQTAIRKAEPPKT